MMLQGLRTIVYPAPDLTRAKEFYSALCGVGPYFDQPFYVGFNVGGYELGLDPNLPASESTRGPQMYWGVAEIESALAHAIAVGARPKTPIQEVGEGIKIATVLDPFENVVGLIENPNFKLQA